MPTHREPNAAPDTSTEPGGVAASDAAPGAAPGAPVDLNHIVRYTAWAVYGRSAAAPDDEGAATTELHAWAEGLADGDIILRGCYDVSGLRADTDLMLWLHGPSAESLQHALRGFRRTEAGRATTLRWSVMGTHRPAEFSRDHVPSFMTGTQALDWLCVYPFVRSYEWYLLPQDERRAMLRGRSMASSQIKRSL